MAELMKRATAMILALILILGQVALPVIADDSAAAPTGEATAPTGDPAAPAGDPPPPADYVDTQPIVDGSGNVIGQETTGQKTSTIAVTDQDGNVIGELTNVTQFSEGQTAVHSNGGVDTHEWSEETTDSKKTTTSETSETKQPIPKPDGWQGEWGKEWDEPTKTNPGAADKPTSNTTDTKGDMEEDKNWKPGKPLDDNQFKDVSTTPKPSTEENPNPKITEHEAVPETIVIPYDRLTDAAGDDVTITTKPGDTGTKAITRQVTAEDIAKGRYPEIFDPSKDIPEGYGEPVVTEYTEDGQPKGWKITFTKVETSQRTQIGDIETEILNRTVQEGSTPVDASKIEQYEELIAKGGTETGENEQGQPYTRQVEKIEKDGKDAYKETVETVISTSTETTYDDSILNDETNYPTQEESVASTPVFTPPAPAPAESTTYHGDGTYTQVTVTKLYDDKGELALNIGDEVGYTVSTVLYDINGNVIESSEQDYYGTRTEKTVTTTLDPTTMMLETTTKITERKITEVWAEQFSSLVEYKQTKTEEQTVTTDTIEDTFELVQTENGMLFVYTATMSEVDGTTQTLLDDTLAGGKVVKDANGNLVTKDGVIVLIDSSVDLNGDLLLDDLRILGDGKGKGYIDKNKQYTGKITSTAENIAGANADDWRKIGIGLQGGFTTWDDDANGDNLRGRHTPQQYMIYDGENVRFVYCVELGASIKENENYVSNLDTTPEDNSDKVFGNAAGNMRQVSIVATNGFWGTREGLGSLEEVKKLLIENNLSDVAERLTEGKAMAATQLALWEFAHTSNGAGFNRENGDYVTWDDSGNGGEGAAPSDTDQEDIHALRNLLIDLAKNPDPVETKVEAITKESISGGGVVVKQTLLDQEGNVVVNNDGQAKYNTDLKFKLSVSSSSITGNLVVELSDPVTKEVLAKARLAGDNSQDATLWDNIRNLGTIRPDEDGYYTLKDVELFEGQKVNIRLDGIQMLENGIYVYKNDKSQDFLGLATKQNKIDLNFDLSFSVGDPSVKQNRDGQTEQVTNTIVSQREGTRIDTINITFTKESYETDTDVHKKQTVLGTKTISEETVERFRAGRRWQRFAHYDPMPINDEDGGGGNGGGGDIPLLPGLDIPDAPVPLAHDPEGVIGIPDEGVPLADAPATGDASLVWAAMGMMSMGGYVFLGKKDKKPRKGGKYLKK